MGFFSWVSDAVDVAHAVVDPSYVGRNAATRTDTLSTEQRKQTSEDIQAQQTNLAATIQGADATVKVYKDAGDYAANKVEGVREFASGGAVSDEVVKNQLKMLDHIRELASTDKMDDKGKPVLDSSGKPMAKTSVEQHADDAQLVKEMQENINDRLATLQKKGEAGEDVSKEREALQKLQGTSLAPDKNLSAEERKEVANVSRTLTGIKANNRISEITGNAMGAAQNLEDGLITGAAVLAGAVSGGVGGLVVSQAVNVADQSNAMGKPIVTDPNDPEANRKSGAIGKLGAALITGDAEKAKSITWADGIGDAVDIGLTFAPFLKGGNQAVKGAEQALASEVMKDVTHAGVNQGVKEVAKEGEKEVTKTLGEKAVAWGADWLKGKAKDYATTQGKQLATNAASALTGSDTVAGSFGKSDAPTQTPPAVAAAPPAKLEPSPAKPAAPAIATNDAAAEKPAIADAPPNPSMAPGKQQPAVASAASEAKDAGMDAPGGLASRVKGDNAPGSLKPPAAEVAGAENMFSKNPLVAILMVVMSYLTGGKPDGLGGNAQDAVAAAPAGSPSPAPAAPAPNVAKAAEKSPPAKANASAAPAASASDMAKSGDKAPSAMPGMGASGLPANIGKELTSVVAGIGAALKESGVALEKSAPAITDVITAAVVSVAGPQRGSERSV